MKTFGNTKGGASDYEQEAKYWKDVNVFPRKLFQTNPNQFHVSVVGGILPMVTYTAETIGGKEFPIACSAFNPETEEYDGVNPLRDYWQKNGTQAYLANVLIHEYVTDHRKNPNAQLGPICVMEMTAGIITGIVNVQEAWNVDICSDAALSTVCLTGSTTGGGNTPLKYILTGVPAKAGYSMAWINEQIAAGAATLWDLKRYAESKMFSPVSMLTFLARNKYSFVSEDVPLTIEELDAYAEKYAAHGPRYRLALTKADFEHMKSQYPAGEDAAWGWECWETSREKIVNVLNKAWNGDSGEDSPGMSGSAPGRFAGNAPSAPPAAAPAAPAAPGAPAAPAAPAPAAPAPAAPAAAPAPAAPAPAAPAPAAPAAAPAPAAPAPAAPAAAPAPAAPAAPAAAPAPAAPPVVGGLPPTPATPPLAQ